MHRRLWASWWSCDACDASWWSCDACDACEARNAGTHAQMRYACDARDACGARLARGARGVCGAPAASGSRATLDRRAVLSWSTASTLGPADCSPPARSSFLVSSDPDFLRSPCLLASCPSLLPPILSSPFIRLPSLLRLHVDNACARARMRLLTPARVTRMRARTLRGW